MVGAIAPEKCYVIGDTPHDIRCGKAIGARVVAVASGGYSVEALENVNHGGQFLVCQNQPSLCKKLG